MNTPVLHLPVLNTLVMNARGLTETPSRARSPVERAVLLTLVYSDLFDFPLTADELRRYLPVPCSTAELDEALDALDGSCIVRRDGYLCLAGRGEIVGIRRRRAETAAARWRAAERFASWLAWIPFLRMTAVCGSVAADNAGPEGDVDLFLITAPGRLWLVQSITMVLRRLGRLRLGVEICPNFFMDRDRLEIEKHDLYVAREIAQAVPLWGEDEYERFLAANRWISDFLPQVDLDERRRLLRPADRPRLTRFLERALGGRLGTVLERGIYRTLLVYYRLRLRPRGFRREDVERAYRPDRQSLISEGYAGAVARKFFERAREVLELAGDDAGRDEIVDCFFGDGRGTADGHAAGSYVAAPHFAGLFDRRYGSAHE